MTGRGQWCETYRCKQIDDESTGSECRRHNRLLLLDAPPATPPGPASTSTLGDRTSLARRGRPSLIYRWRRDLRAAANGFAQVLVAPTAEVSPYLHGFAELAHNLTRRRCPTGFDHRCDLLGRAPPYGGPRVRIHLPPAESLSPAGLYLRGSRTPAFRAGFEAAFSARSAESRRAANIAPTRSSISVGLYSSTAFPAMRSRQVVGLKSPGGSPNEIGLLGSGMLVDLESSDRAQAKPSAAR
jgi:hypothetical protein